MELVKRTRISAPRARTGCTTCKLRHVKCGEERPSCRRCIDTGRICDGYPSARSNDDQLLVGKGLGSSKRPVSAATAAALNAAAITSYSIPFKVPGSQRDRQKLHYFCVQGALDISGNSSCTSDFWTTMVLQCSYEEPVVRSALIALSSIHLDLVTSDCSLEENAPQELTSIDTLTQYGKAIRQLRRYLTNSEQPSVKVALVCSLLFYCFESARQDYHAALAHLQNGVVILRDQKRRGPDEAKRGRTTIMPDELRDLERQFTRMDLQATFFDDAGRVPSLEFTSEDERSGITPIVSTTMFKDLDEAHLALDKLRNQAWRFLLNAAQYKHLPLDRVPTRVMVEKAQLVSQFERWSVALDNLWDQQHYHLFNSNSQPDTDYPDLTTFRESATLLKLPHRSTQIILLSNLPANDTIFSAIPNARGREIISLIESLHSIDLSRRTYSSEGGIIAPLIMLAAKCRDPQVYGKAIELLAMSKRREGLIDGQMIVRVAANLAAVRDCRQSLYHRHPTRHTAQLIAHNSSFDSTQLLPISDQQERSGNVNVRGQMGDDGTVTADPDAILSFFPGDSHLVSQVAEVLRRGCPF